MAVPIFRGSGCQDTTCEARCSLGLFFKSSTATVTRNLDSSQGSTLTYYLLSLQVTTEQRLSLLAQNKPSKRPTHHGSFSSPPIPAALSAPVPTHAPAAASAPAPAHAPSPATAAATHAPTAAAATAADNIPAVSATVTDSTPAAAATETDSTPAAAATAAIAGAATAAATAGDTPRRPSSTPTFWAASPAKDHIPAADCQRAWTRAFPLPPPPRPAAAVPAAGARSPPRRRRPRPSSHRVASSAKRGETAARRPPLPEDRRRHRRSTPWRERTRPRLCRPLGCWCRLVRRLCLGWHQAARFPAPWLRVWHRTRARW